MPRHLSLALSTLLVTCSLASACTGVLTAGHVENAAKAPANGCAPVEFLTGLASVDHVNFEQVGSITVRYRSNLSDAEKRQVFEEAVKKEECGWGATHVHAPSLGVQTHVHGGFMKATKLEFLTLYRKLQPGESSAYARQLGIDEDSLKKQVAFDTGCTAERVSILRKVETQGSGTYDLVACERAFRYERTGTVFQMKQEAEIQQAVPAAPSVKL
jgi:hypothetical protein